MCVPWTDGNHLLTYLVSSEYLSKIITFRLIDLLNDIKHTIFVRRYVCINIVIVINK